MSFVSKGDISRLKQGEEEKRKRYTALCVTAKPVSKEILDRLESLGEVRWPILLIFQETLHSLQVKIQQETPVRVLHRRSNAIREKVQNVFNRLLS